MKKGFTLAEVLIALTIVGVIAILTLPSLISTYKFKLYTTQLERAYAQIDTAIQQIMADVHADNFNSDDPDAPTGFYATSAAFYVTPFLNKYFKHGKECNVSNGLCGTENIVYKSPSGKEITSFRSRSNAVISTSNGATIMMIGLTSSNTTPLIFLDANGEKDPNTTGYDVFWLKINNDGSVTDIDEDPDKCGTATTDYLDDISAGCFARFIKNGRQVKKI